MCIVASSLSNDAVSDVADRFHVETAHTSATSPAGLGWCRSSKLIDTTGDASKTGRHAYSFYATGTRCLFCADQDWAGRTTLLNNTLKRLRQERGDLDHG